ncbi:MAG: lipid IV(A) 3-deoxy-D-manno-octulosonic acid transferase [Gammaproteobacteria bacterium]
MRYLYTVLFYLALPFVFLRLLWRSRRAPLYRQRWVERLGYCPHQLDQCIWVHAVSLGETIAAVPLIKQLKAKYPQSPVLVTNMTVTGSERVKAIFGESVLNAYVPYDLPDMVARFIERVNPQVIVVMETELWPNLFAAAKRRRIPLVVTNARLSEKSAKGYRRVKSLAREMFTAITVLAAQGQSDADRFIDLGMPASRVKVTGSLKFDLELPADLETKGKILREALKDMRPIWIAASTHPGEDEIILAAHRVVRDTIKNALLILVPRHPERFDSVAAMIKENNLSVIRRSTGESCEIETAVYLGDTMGEMLLMFSACDVAFVAGSFVAIGGHNIIEPAALHKPVITGPYLFNFSEISDAMLAARGMIKVNNSDELANTLIKFFEDETVRQQTGENAFGVVEKNRGALQRQVALIDASF